jgi:ABC-type sulfate/molybdate transport systems ATPase subunit
MELFVDIKKRLPEFTLDLTFHSRNGTLGLLGASGSGKSITLKCIAGLIKPDSGKIILNNRVLFDSSKNIDMPIKDRKIGFLFQNYALFPNMTVEQNIGYALNKLTKADRNKIIDDIIERIKLKTLRKRYPSQLSGGQQQRVALARALAINPDAILLDEPFSALDNHLRNIMLKQMIDTLANFNGISLFVTHNMDEAYQLCSNIVILEKGIKKGDSSKSDMFINPPTLAAAKLTGCKNLSSVKKLNDHSIEAVDWKCKISFEKTLPISITHVGIRAHYIEIIDEFLVDKNLENTYHCWQARYTETPFRKFVFLKLNKPPFDGSDYDLMLDISTEEWEILNKKPLPWLVKLNPDKLILINDDL